LCALIKLIFLSLAMINIFVEKYLIGRYNDSFYFTFKLFVMFTSRVGNVSCTVLL